MVSSMSAGGTLPSAEREIELSQHHQVYLTGAQHDGAAHLGIVGSDVGVPVDHLDAAGPGMESERRLGLPGRPLDEDVAILRREAWNVGITHCIEGGQLRLEALGQGNCHVGPTCRSLALVEMYE